MNSGKRVIAVVFSEKEMRKKVEGLKERGYEEEEIHILVQDAEPLGFWKQETDAAIEEANSIKDKFKSFVTGESSVRESIKSLELSDSETERYTAAVARGGILLYVEDQANIKGFEES